MTASASQLLQNLPHTTDVPFCRRQPQRKRPTSPSLQALLTTSTI